MKIKYIEQRFNESSREIIDAANTIIAEYQADGFRLTLRQLYYQFVARDFLGNTIQNYKRLGSIINDARLAGLISWEAIEDRTRNLVSPSTWSSPAQIISACAEQFKIDKWRSQPNRIEVWIEKEALAGVFDRACREYDIPFFCCRGYTSQSEMWRAGMRLKRYQQQGFKPVILHFGDHDPSGMDMSRDIADRLNLFMGGAGLKFSRLALNMKQVKAFNPPPNPAKETDSRCGEYIRQYGDQSWELDALDPKHLAGLVKTAVERHINKEAWRTACRSEEVQRDELVTVSDKWDEVVEFAGKLNS